MERKAPGNKDQPHPSRRTATNTFRFGVSSVILPLEISAPRVIVQPLLTMFIN